MEADWLVQIRTFFSGDWGNAFQSMIAVIGAVIAVVFGAVKLLSQQKPVIEPTLDPQPDFKPLQQQYYKDLARECNLYNLDDIDENNENQYSLSLSDVYYDQFVSLTDPAEDSADDDALLRSATHQRVALLEAIERIDDHAIVIRGIVGSGKTGFVNYLVGGIIASYHSAQPEDFPGSFCRRPVIRLQLRNWAQPCQIRRQARHRIQHIGCYWMRCRITYRNNYSTASKISKHLNTVV